MQISLNFKSSCYNLKVRGLGSRSCGLFFSFSFERYYDVVKSKNPCFFKNINFNKKKKNGIENEKIPRRFLERQTLCFSSYKNRTLKAKLW